MPQNPPVPDLQRDQTVTGTLANGFGAAGDTEFGVQRRDVELYRMLADVQLAGDELVGESSAQQFQHLALAWGQGLIEVFYQAWGLQYPLR